VTLLTDFDMVALDNDGFPDNSAVCHALRAVGVYQDSFVGGGAMAVPIGEATGFFPNIYNEDWLFLVGDGQLRRTAVTGKVTQKPFNPFANPARPRAGTGGLPRRRALLTSRRWRRGPRHRAGVLARIPAQPPRPYRHGSGEDP
jgi:hypothetical protein